MTSKYDEFWTELLAELSEAVDRAAVDEPVIVHIDGIRSLGDRQSWYGTAIVRGTDIEQVAMAHMRSLGEVVASSGVCSRWPDNAFRFTMSSDASRLTVTRAGMRSRRPSGVAASAKAVKQSQPRIPTPAADARVVKPEVACGELHRLLAQLPTRTAPGEVPFANGLYFYYEDGERSTHVVSERIVRIGNHPKSQDRLIGRLRDHYRSRAGAKNGSVFRRYLGGAVLRSRDATSTCLLPGPGRGHWESQGGEACPDCAPVEATVSHLLAERFQFRCIRIDDQAVRNELEARLIATVAACTECQPSPGWLGSHAYPELVRRSGLWNAQFVGGPTATAGDLVLLQRLVAATQRSESPTGSLDDTLLLIPCSGSKEGAADLGRPVVRMGDLLGPVAASTLAEGRKLAFQRPGTQLDLDSAPRPALAWYTGQPYATSGVRAGLIAAIERGLHCLIVSGGYGVVRAEEPIHKYQAHLSKTRGVWSRRLPAILRDYVDRNNITRTITVVSSVYAAVLPMNLTGNDARCVPSFSHQVDEGAALQVVPARVGALLADVLAQL